MGIGLALALGYWYYKNKKANANAATTAGSGTVSSSDIPQFVNQTYVNTTPPDTDDHTNNHPPEQLTRTWQAIATASTLAQVGARLGVTDPAKNLHPANKLATDFMKAYAKNHNAKIPKGALFTYTEGTVTPKAGAKT